MYHHSVDRTYDTLTAISLGKLRAMFEVQGNYLSGHPLYHREMAQDVMKTDAPLIHLLSMKTKLGRENDLLTFLEGNPYTACEERHKMDVKSPYLTR